MKIIAKMDRNFRSEDGTTSNIDMKLCDKIEMKIPG